MNNLSASQKNFYQWLNQHAPELMYLWDWNVRLVDLDGIQRYLDTASHGEAMMCRFVVAVWFGKNRFSFDLIDAADIINPSKRQVIADWFLNPFWP